MEQKKKQEVSNDRLPRLSARYPWFVVQNMEDDMDDYIFSTLQNPSFSYKCRIPDLLGGRIRGSFHGWLILSNHPYNNRWSLYNISDSNVIHLPPLIFQDGNCQPIRECCLSASPDDPNSVILLTITNKPTFVFCLVSPKRKKPRWSEMSYSTQLKKFTLDGKLLHSLTCCNGKIYALNTDSVLSDFFIEVGIEVKDRKVVIKLSLFGPRPFLPSYRNWIHFLKGFGPELFYIVVAFHDKTKKAVFDVYFFKLDMTHINWEELEGVKDWDMTGKMLDDLVYEDFEHLDIARGLWEEVHDLKDAVFFLDLGRDNLIFYNPAIASEFGGFIHMRDKMDNVIHSYHVNYQTLASFPIPSPSLPTSHISICECRLQDDHGETKPIVDTDKEQDEIVVKSVTNDQVEFDESGLLIIPFDVLAMIMKIGVGVEYMNFRATCKRCHLAAPLIQWRNKTALRRLQNYSLVSPWLMVVQKHRGVITFKDPLLGDDYYMKILQISVSSVKKIYCSRFGWLVFQLTDLCLVFFNPFTNDLHKLPNLHHSLESLCFSAPPTSPDCMVVGFGGVRDWQVHIHFVNGEPTWRTFSLGVAKPPLRSTTLYGQDLYALSKKRELIVFKKSGEDYAWMIFKAKAPRSSCRSGAQYFLVKCDQHLLLLIMGGIGDPIELFKPNYSTQKWEKINGIGKHAIYISNTLCLCIEAKMPEMENKIYLPQVCSTNGKIVFYSLETCTFHTFNGKNVQENVRDISNATHLSAHAWVEPSWS